MNHPQNIGHPPSSATGAGELALYLLRIDGLAAQADTFAHLIEKGQCYLSPNTKLADQGKCAQLSDVTLAEAFAAAALPVLRKRHGDQVALEVEAWRSVPSATELARIMARVRHDTSVVRARLREKNFAPNRAPLIIAADLT
jgi:hypothetical protein